MLPGFGIMSEVIAVNARKDLNRGIVRSRRGSWRQIANLRYLRLRFES